MALERVPTSVLGPIVKHLLYPRGMLRDIYSDPTLLEEVDLTVVVADRAGLHRDTVYNVMTQARASCDFDVADRIICALDAVHLWRVEPLKEIYDSIDLSITECANPLCHKTFKVGRVRQGVTRRLYCSTRCKAAVFEQRHTDGRRMGVKQKPGMCRKGLHELTPENITPKYGRSTGQCKACRLASYRAKYAERKAA